MPNVRLKSLSRRSVNSFAQSDGALLDQSDRSEQAICNKNWLASQYALQQGQLHRLMLTQERLCATQEETARALSELSLAIRDLHIAVEDGRTLPERQSQTPPLQQPSRRAPQSGRIRRENTGSGCNPFCLSNPLLYQPRLRASAISDHDASMDNLDDESLHDDELGFDRKQVRLDGLEVYAVVSALTTGTLVTVFDSYNPGSDIVDMFVEGRYLELIMSMVFMTTGTIGIVCGLHCIVVFSLVTMYGRTALGMERDDALEVFFGDTGLQRIHGFRTFMGSLYALMIQMIIVIASKISNNPLVLLAVLVVTGRLMYYVHNDTQTIMEKAMVIFSSPSPLQKDSMISAVSAISAQNDDARDKNEDAKSIKSKDDMNDTTRLSTSVASRGSKSDKPSKLAVGRRSQLSKNHSAGSTMNLPAAAFGDVSRKSLLWSLSDGESRQDGNNVDGSSHSLGSCIVDVLSNVKSRKKRSSLSPPAAEELRNSIKGIVDEDGKNDVLGPNKRSALTQPAAMQIIENEDSMNSVDSEYSCY